MSATKSNLPLSRFERDLIEQIAAGQFAMFTGPPLPQIRGSLLRQLLLAEVLPGHTKPVVIPLPGIRLSGARITDNVDLADFARPGAGLPALVLENCVLDGELNLTGARVARLSVKNSRFTCIRLREAEVDGPFDFSDARPLEHADVAWIDARDGLFHGQITGKAAKLSLPKTWEVPDERPNALWLNNADVRGSLMLAGIEANGGVGISAAHIRGNVVLRGAKLTSGPDDALLAQNARIGGSLVADEGFVAAGRVWLLGAHFGNGVQLSRSTISGQFGAPADDVARGVALILENTRIGANLFIDDAVVNGQILLHNSQIGGNFDCTRLILKPMPDAPMYTQSEPTSAMLNATGVRIAGNATFDDAFVRGWLDLTAIDVTGNLSFVRAALMNRRFGMGNTTALSLVNASIGKDANFGELTPNGREIALVHSAAPVVGQLNIDVELETQEAIQQPELAAIPRLGIRLVAAGVTGTYSANARHLSSATDIVLLPLQLGYDAAALIMGSSGQPERYSLVMQGLLEMTGATFNKDLKFANCMFDGWLSDGSGVSVCGDRMRVVGTLSFQLASFLGRVNLSAADVGRDIRFQHTVLMNTTSLPEPSDAIHAKDLKVGSNCELDHVVVAGNAVLERLEVNGSLSWSAVTALRASPYQAASANAIGTGQGIVDLGMAQIGTALKARDLSLADDVRLSLGGAHVSQLELWWPGGWGGEPRSKTDKRLNLDGFEYERLVFAETSTRKHAGRWLACHERGTGFSPQPYRQLSAVLRAQGNEAAARDISVRERWRTPQPWWLRPFWAIYGVLFGFGFRPAAALLTLIGWVAIGTGFVWLAKQENVLKQTVVVASNAISVEDATATRNVFQVVSAGSPQFLHELPCSDAAINPVDDVIFAVDMILPFIPLHQQSRCEISAGEVFVHMQQTDNGAAQLNTEASNVWAWRLGRAAYTVIGWIFVSLALITFAGVVKRAEAAEGD